MVDRSYLVVLQLQVWSDPADLDAHVQPLVRARRRAFLAWPALDPACAVNSQKLSDKSSSCVFSTEFYIATTAATDVLSYVSVNILDRVSVAECDSS